MSRIIKKGKTALASSILNILGLTAAFAALYIILVQVHHDLTYNKALKDSDQIYCMSATSLPTTVPHRGLTARYRRLSSRPRPTWKLAAAHIFIKIAPTATSLSTTSVR